MVHIDVDHTADVAALGHRQHVHQKLHLKYGAAAALAQVTVVSVVDVILALVQHLADIMAKKQLDDKTDNLYLDVPITFVQEPEAMAQPTTAVGALQHVETDLEDVGVGSVDQVYVVSV